VSLNNNASVLQLRICFEFTTQYTYFSALRQSIYSRCRNGNGNDSMGMGSEWKQQSFPHTSILVQAVLLNLILCVCNVIALALATTFLARFEVNIVQHCTAASAPRLCA